MEHIITRWLILSGLPLIFLAAQAVFAATELHFKQLRESVQVETPDPFLNAAVGALNVAVDAVWDEAQAAVSASRMSRTRLIAASPPSSQLSLV